MTNMNKKALLNKVLIIYVVIVLLIALGAVLCSMLWKVPLKLKSLQIDIELDALIIDSIEIDDFEIEGMQLVLDKEENSKEIEEIVNLFNSSKKFRDDVGTTHPKRVRFIIKDKLIVSLWYGTQGFITVSDSNKQFNMQNKRLEEYFDKLLKSSIE